MAKNIPSVTFSNRLAVVAPTTIFHLQPANITHKNHCQTSLLFLQCVGMVPSQR